MNRYKTLFLLSVPFLFGIVSLVLGRDSNWDLLNYRWYNAFSLLNGRLETDVLVANHATFYNPVLELPFYLIATHFPAVIAGFAVGFVDGLPFVPLYLLAELFLPASSKKTRMALCSAVAGAGFLGGGVIGQIGIISWDVPLATLNLFAVYIIVRDSAVALLDTPGRRWKWLVLSGFLAGSAAGLKLTAAIFPVGIALALLCCGTGGLVKRMTRNAIFSLGVIAGVLVFGGYWMVCLYHAFGNPTFPYFNNVFHSPSADIGNNRDTTFMPKSWLEALFFPILFSLNSHYVAEYDFRDVHIALTWLLLLGVGFLIVRPAAGFPVRIGRAQSFLLIFFAASYCVWEALFSIYRYVLPLELMAPLLIALIVTALPIPARRQLQLLVGLLAVAELACRADFHRREWTRNYVDVHLAYNIPDDSLVLMRGPEPMGFAASVFPPSVAVLRVDSPLGDIGDPGNKFGAEINSRVANAKGPIFVLSASAGSGGCDTVTSNVSQPLYLCPAATRP